MLKRISKILLCVLLLFIMTACTNDENSLPNNNDVQNKEEEKNDENIPSNEENTENIDSSNKEENIEKPNENKDNNNTTKPNTGVQPKPPVVDKDTVNNNQNNTENNKNETNKEDSSGSNEITNLEVKKRILAIYNNNILYSDGSETKNDGNITGYPVLISNISKIKDSFVNKFSLVEESILKKISKIEYAPNDMYSERFLLYMKDNSWVYITLSNIKIINKYDNLYNSILSQLSNDKYAIFYLEAGNYVEIKDILGKEEEKEPEDTSSKYPVYNDGLAHIDIYYSNYCSHCNDLFSFLDSLDQSVKSKIVIAKYDIEEHKDRYSEISKKISGDIGTAVPYGVFNNEKAVLGFIEEDYIKYISEYTGLYLSKKEPEEPKEDIITKLTNETPVGYKLYTHNVSMSDTFGNSILPNSYVGIYAKINTESNMYFGNIITNIKILAVLDENNENAFSENETKTPSKILFYLSNSDYSLLDKAKGLGEISLIPGSTSNLNQEVIDYILNS